MLLPVAVYYKAPSHVINGTVDDTTSFSLPHKQYKTNNNDGHHIHHIHHTSTQHHRREQLLMGWEQVLLQNERTATPLRGRSNERRPKGRQMTSLGPLVSFFFFSFPYFIAKISAVRNWHPLCKQVRVRVSPQIQVRIFVKKFGWGATTSDNT